MRQSRTKASYAWMIGNKLASGHVCSEKAREKMRLAKIGKKQTKEQVEKRRKSLSGRKWSKEMYKNRSGENSHLWKDNIGYSAIHAWLYKMFGKAKICQLCKKKNKKNYEWSNKDGNYLERNKKHWWQLCSSCHRKFDLNK